MTVAAFWVMLGAAILTAAFAAAQASLRSASRSRLKELAQQAGRLDRLTPILDDLAGHALAAAPLRVLAGLAVVAAAFVWTSGVGDGSRVTWGELTLASGVAFGLLLLLGEVIPMSIADHAGEAFVMRCATLIRACYFLTLPMHGAMRVIEEIVHRLAGSPDGSREEELERELLSVVTEAEQEGGLNPAERHMLKAVVDFRTRTVDEVMTPRTEIEGIEKTNDLLAIKAFIGEAGHSRIPVYEGDLDHIIGVLYAKDLLRHLAEDVAEFSIAGALRPAQFVPETKPIGEMLLEFQRDKVHLALVLDEYGGTAGLVTIEDVLEEIVGEIHDEFEPVDETPPDIDVSAADRALEVDARASVSDVNDRLESLGVSLPESDDYDTIAGFVTTELGRLPEEGETFRKNGFLVTVLGAEPTRVTRVRIDFRAPAEDPTPAVDATGG